MDAVRRHLSMCYEYLFRPVNGGFDTHSWWLVVGVGVIEFHGLAHDFEGRDGSRLQFIGQDVALRCIDYQMIAVDRG